MSMALDNRQAFASARPVAQHCPELVRRGPRPEERAEALAAWRRDCAAALAASLAQMLPGERPRVSIGEPEMMAGSEVFARIGPVAANSLLRCGPAQAIALLSFDFATAIALTDRTFGGAGEIGQDAPDQLPRSAALTVEQFAGQLAEAIGEATSPAAEKQAGPEKQAGDVIARSDSAKRLKPFDPDARCAVFAVTVTAGEGATWTATLALRDDLLDSLLPGTATAGQPMPALPPERAATIRPFARIPLMLEAVLAELDLSLERIARLRPGDEIPLAMPRSVPLKMGEEIVAHGTLGTFEDRMALRLTANPAEGGLA